MSGEHIQFITGRLAEHSLRSTLAAIAPQIGFAYTVDVLPITVAALMTPAWVAKHMHHVPEATRIVLPGYCEGDLEPIHARFTVPIQRGPRDLRQLPEFFGRGDITKKDYGAYDIQIIAEINHAPRLTLSQILAQAKKLAADGADLIDVGCDPGGTWSGVAECVRALKNEGHRVSIDSLNPAEIQPATQAGAELVLSVNATNRHAAADWGCEVVVIPDEFATLGGLEETIELLASQNVRLRIDPILEPIGCGFAASLGRYIDVRARYPDAEIMMGIGNITELTDADSAPINVVLLGICQELGVRSVLTTQVINWARSSVRECDLARRLVYYAVKEKIPPKHLDPQLVLLRDKTLRPFGDETLDRLAEQIKDTNYRIFAENDAIHLLGAGFHGREHDPFLLFDQLLATQPKNLDASHAFYLGFEMAKALTALTLSKEYRQDESLDWGYLTLHETSHRLRKSQAKQESAP